MNILIYGTGKAARRFFINQLSLDKVNLLAFIDREVDENNKYFENYKIITREEINNYTYDYIIIASTFVSIYDTLIDEFSISEYKVIPAFYHGKHPMLENAIMGEITSSKCNNIQLSIKKSFNNERQIIDNICIKSDDYVRDKILVKILESFDISKLDDIYMIGRPNTYTANLITKLLKKPIYFQHSIEDSFEMGLVNDQQKENLEKWEKILEDEMKFSQKTVLQQFEDFNMINYNYGFYSDLMNQYMNRISLVYIETVNLNTFKLIIKSIFEKVNNNGYIYLYNPLLTEEESQSNLEITEFMKSEYTNLLKISLINDKFGLLWYKI